MTSRAPSVRPSPLMLMVLALLAEAPMHPYEMQRLMQFRGKTQVVRVQRGSLYPAVDRLVRAGLVEPAETGREGRRPERTVYRITDEGRETAHNWLLDMLGTVRNEYPEFPAALSFLALASSDVALAQFTARALALGREVAALRSQFADLRERYELPRLFSIEDEYRLVVLEAELRWVTGVIDDLRSGAFRWDRESVIAWAEGLRARFGAFPGIPRDPSGDQDLPP